MPKVGAPVTVFTPERKKELVILLRKYIHETEIPILAEFAYINDVVRSSLYSVPEFSTLLKRLVAKKEFALERKSLDGKINTTQAIFSLKQLGWRDRQEIEHSGGIRSYQISEDFLPKDSEKDD